MDIDQMSRAVRTADELRKLPGFVDRVDPAKTGLRRVIWPYNFRSEIHCALTNCGTRHKEGVIIELEDGSVSNIGHICGGDADKFSNKFTIEMLKMSQSRRRDELMPVLLNRGRLEEIERSVRTACAGARVWVTRLQEFAAAYPDADREVRRRLSAGESMSVIEVEERSQAEISDMVDSGRARNRAEARYKQVERGVIRGTRVIGLTEQKLDSLWRRADALLAADPQAVDVQGLQRLFGETVHLPGDARGIIDACQDGPLFFSSENFKLIAALPMSAASKASLNRLTAMSWT